MAETASIHTRPLGDRSLLQVIGEIDILTSPALREAIRPLLGRRGGLPILDLSGVSYMDSSGLNVLVGAARQIVPARFPVVGCRRNLRRLLEVSGLDVAFRLFDTLDEALADGA